MFSLARQSWRSWKTAKGLGLLAVVALAVGIGCATAIFTVVNAVLLKPLPYSEGDRWVELLGASTVGTESDRYSGLSLSDVVTYQEHTRSFDTFGWFKIGGDFNLRSPGAPEHLDGVEITPSLISSIGVQPIRGRVFTPSDGTQVVLISERLWRRLGANPSLVGRAVVLNSESYTVVGVMPSWFVMPIGFFAVQTANNDVWIPVKPVSDEAMRRSYAVFSAYARLKPGVTVKQARADAERVASEIVRENPQRHRSDTVAVFSLRDFVTRDVRPILLLLFGASVLLLGITCANVAGLLVTRSVARARETALRVALGGGQAQLAAQFFFDGLFVSVAAAALGVGCSTVLVRFVISLAAGYIPRANEISLNWIVMLFAIGMGGVTAVLASLAPLWQARRTQPNDVLNDGIRASASARSRRLSRLLVVLEIALAFTLLTAGALFLAQLGKLNRTSPGFDPNNVLSLHLLFADARLTNDAELTADQHNILRRVATIPGVSSAALANQLPLAGCCFSGSAFPEGVSMRSEFVRPLSFMFVSPDYFRTMRIPLLSGRLLNDHDSNENQIAVVIEEATAKRYWGNRNPVGLVLHAGAPNGTPLHVVGVAGNVRNEGLGKASMPAVYFLYSINAPTSLYLVVRSNLSTGSLLTSIRRAVLAVDPAQPIYGAQTMQDIVASSLTLERIESVVIGFFACAALLMASLGVYGISSYSVRQRTVEIGTRMALGATERNVLWLVLRDALQMAMAAVLLGALTVAGVTLIVSRFFSVQDVGAIPYLASIAITICLVMLASAVPAWRATLVSPMAAIRNEADSLWTSTRRSVQRVLSFRPPDERQAGFDSTLLNEFIDASRRAESFPQALRAALVTVRKTVRAESLLLLERAADDEYRCVVSLPQEKNNTCSIPARGFLLNRIRFYSSPLAFAPDDLQTCLKWAVQQKPQYQAEIETLQQAGTRLAVALGTRHETLGLLLLGEPVGRNTYSPGEKKLLQVCAEQFALMMENSRLTDRVVEQEKLRRDVALAAEVQKRLLPEGSPKSATSSLGAFTLPVRSVGGDYYDFLEIGERRIGIALADVAGKGIAAALIMAIIHASLRIIAADGRIALPALAAKMNSFLHQSTGASSYATFFYAEMDEERRQLHYVNAGHNPPYLVRNIDATVEELTTGGMIIGMFPFAAYEQATVDLKPGDVLLAFTDGVTEALNPDEEEFGEARLKALVQRIARLNVDEIKACISGELRKWIGPAAQHDDLTFIVMKVN